MGGNTVEQQRLISYWLYWYIIKKKLLKNLAWFCRYINGNHVNKLMRSTTVVRFFSFVLSSLLKAHGRAGKATGDKYMNEKLRGKKKKKIKIRLCFETKGKT